MSQQHHGVAANDLDEPIIVGASAPTSGADLPLPTIREARTAAESQRRSELRQAVALAIEVGEITIHYQPIVSIKKNKVVVVEALARWVHPTYGSVPPREFVALAEEEGCINRLTDLVLAKASRDLVVFRKLPGSSGLALAVNLAPQELIDVDLTRRIALVLDEHRLPARALHLEINESIISFNIDSVVAELKRLRKYGLRITLSNAGTSASTLQLLQTMPVDTMKIDRCHTAALSDPQGDAGVVEAIVALSESFKKPVIAQGIEDIAQLVRVRQLGIEMAQGYLWRPPVPAEELIRYLRMRYRQNRRGLRKRASSRPTVVEI